MTKGKAWKLILIFTLPIMAGYLLQQLYSIVDGIIVGNYISETAFAAVSTCQPLTFFYTALAVGLSVGVGIIVSQNFGAGNESKLPVVIDTALILHGACGLIFTFLGVALSETLLRHLLNVPEYLIPDAVAYIRVYSIGLVFQFLYNGVASTLRGMGDSKATLYFLLISTVLSTALTFVFILVIKWGVAGAAFSTVLAQAVCAAVSYLYLRKRFPYDKSGRHWDRSVAVTMTKLGMPIAIQLSIVSFGTGTMQRLVNSFEGTYPGVVAAYGAAIRMDMLVQVPILGFQSGLASFTGQNIGAGKLDRAKRGFLATLIMSTSTIIVLSILYNLLAEPIIGFFGLTDDSLRYGIEQARYMTMCYWIFSVFMSLGGLLQGAGDTILASAATLSALAVRIITGYLAVHLGWLTYSGAWATVPFEWGFELTILYIRFFTGGWKNKAIAGEFSHRDDKTSPE